MQSSMSSKCLRGQNAKALSITTLSSTSTNLDVYAVTFITAQINTSKSCPTLTENSVTFWSSLGIQVVDHKKCEHWNPGRLFAQGILRLLSLRSRRAKARLTGERSCFVMRLFKSSITMQPRTKRGRSFATPKGTLHEGLDRTASETHQGQGGIPSYPLRGTP